MNSSATKNVLAQLLEANVSVDITENQHILQCALPKNLNRLDKQEHYFRLVDNVAFSDFTVNDYDFNYTECQSGCEFIWSCAN